MDQGYDTTLKLWEHLKQAVIDWLKEHGTEPRIRISWDDACDLIKLRPEDIGDYYYDALSKHGPRGFEITGIFGAATMVDTSHKSGPEILPSKAAE